MENVKDGILILSEMKNGDQTLRLKLGVNHFVEQIILIKNISMEQEFFLDQLLIEIMLCLHTTINFVYNENLKNLVLLKLLKNLKIILKMLIIR